MNLLDGCNIVIQDFISELKYVEDYIEKQTGKILNMGWKGHIVQFHLQQFLKKTNLMPGIFSEQCRVKQLSATDFLQMNIITNMAKN